MKLTCYIRSSQTCCLQTEISVSSSYDFCAERKDNQAECLSAVVKITTIAKSITFQGTKYAGLVRHKHEQRRSFAWRRGPAYETQVDDDFNDFTPFSSLQPFISTTTTYHTPTILRFGNISVTAYIPPHSLRYDFVPLSRPSTCYSSQQQHGILRAFRFCTRYLCILDLCTDLSAAF